MWTKPDHDAIRQAIERCRRSLRRLRVLLGLDVEGFELSDLLDDDPFSL